MASDSIFSLIIEATITVFRTLNTLINQKVETYRAGTINRPIRYKIVHTQTTIVS